MPDRQGAEERGVEVRLTPQEIESLIWAAQGAGNFLSKPVHIVEGREVYPEAEVITTLRAALHPTKEEAPDGD